MRELIPLGGVRGGVQGDGKIGDDFPLMRRGKVGQ